MSTFCFVTAHHIVDRLSFETAAHHTFQQLSVLRYEGRRQQQTSNKQTNKQANKDFTITGLNKRIT